MVKRTLNLYVDSNLIDIAKAREINLSELFENVLQNILKDDTAIQKDISLDKLQALEAEKIAELNKLRAMKEHIKLKDEKYFKEYELDEI